MSKGNGGPAFPSKWTNDTGVNTTAPDGQDVPPDYSIEMSGMSLRDWFAGMALNGWISSENCAIPTLETMEKWRNAQAENAYAIADAMLAERNRE